MANIPIYSWSVIPDDNTQYIYILLEPSNGQSILRDVFLGGNLDFFYELQRQSARGFWKSKGWCYAEDVNRLLLDARIKIEQEDKDIL